MGYLACMGASLKCSQGVAPSSLVVVRPMILVTKKPAANVMDFKPIANVPPFGMCNSKSNPQVIAATAAAQGVHTPMPCLPVITGPWSPGAGNVKIEKMKALDDGSTAKCSWNGSITIESAGQTKVQVK